MSKDWNKDFWGRSASCSQKLFCITFGLGWHICSNNSPVVFDYLEVLALQSCWPSSNLGSICMEFVCSCTFMLYVFWFLQTTMAFHVHLPHSFSPQPHPSQDGFAELLASLQHGPNLNAIYVL